MSKAMYVRVDDDVHEEIKILADDEGRSMAKQTNRLLKEALQQRKKRKARQA